MNPVVNRVRQSFVLIIVMALMLVRGLLYVSIIPPWQSPDEPQHYQMIRLFMQLGQVPSRHDVQMAGNLYDVMEESLRENDFWEYRFHLPPPDFQDASSIYDALKENKLTAAIGHPPLYYVLASWVLWPFRDYSALTHLYVLRALSLLMSLVAVWSIYRIAAWLSPLDQSRVWAAPCFIVFLPMYSFLSGSLNNDALAEPLSALAFVALISISLRGLSLARVVGLVVLLFLCLFTKRTTLFLFPLSLVTLLMSIFPEAGRFHVAPGSRPLRSSPWKIYIVAVIMIVILLMALILLYDGLAGHWWDVPLRLGELFSPETYTQTPLIDYAGFLLLSFAGFWANFGWMNIPMDVGWYLVLAILCLFVLIGGLRGALRAWRNRTDPKAHWGVWSVCILAVILVVMQSLASMIVRHIPFQGRYLYPAIVPVGLCFVWGFFEWFPQKHRGAALGIFVTWWIIFDWFSLFGCVLPYFYG